jgi:hypothetical protein
MNLFWSSWEIWELLMFYGMDEINIVEESRHKIGNLENLLNDFNKKIIGWWRIFGLALISLLLVIGYVFCSTSGQLVVLVFSGFLLMSGWFVINNILLKKFSQDMNFLLEYQELIKANIYKGDSFILEAIESCARGNYSRDKLQDLKYLCESLNTIEGLRRAETLLKSLDINLNDIQWIEGSKTGIRVIDENR